MAVVRRTLDRDLIALGARALRRVGSDAGEVLAYGSMLGRYNNSGPLPALTSSGRLTGDPHPAPDRRDRNVVPFAMRSLHVPVRPPWYPAGRIAVNVVKHHAVGRFPAGRRWLQRRGEQQLRDAARRVLDGEIPGVVALPD